MFSFEPASRDQYRSEIDDKIEQRFVMHFGDKALDNRFFLILDKENIRFFYYDNNEQTETLNTDYLKEVGFVSLTYPKDTGNDILAFPQMSCGNLEVLPNTESVKNIIESFEELFYGFPFLEFRTKFKKQAEKKNLKVEKRGGDKERVAGFSKLLKCCFLAFVFEIEDRYEKFACSPLYDQVRDALRKSDVYNLLSAKLQYTLYVPKNSPTYNQNDYSYKAQKFADCLMDKRINKVIPPDYYNEQLWFYTPETELDFIVKRNAKNCKRKGEAKLSDKLLDKIRNFFFTKHAVVSAMGKLWMRIVYWFYICMIGAFSAYATWCLLYFDSDSKIVDLFFKKIVAWDWVTAVSIVLLVVLWMCMKSLSVFMPRVLVAIGIGWLTTFISEDIIKSQVTIEIPLTVAACIGVFLLIGILLLSEIRQHSPYYWGKLQQYHDNLLKKRTKDKKYCCISKLVGFLLWLPAFFIFLFDWKRAKQPSSWKLAPILVHSYFWALSLGVVMQLALYKDILEHSRALPEIVFEQTFDKADNYVLYLNNLRDVLASYEDDWMVLCNGNFRSSGTSKGNDNLSFIKLHQDPNFAMYAERFQHKANDIIGKYDAVRRYRKEIWNDWEKACKKMNVSKGIKSFVDMRYGNADAYPQFTLYSKLMEPIQDLKNENLSINEKYDVITDQLLYLDEVIFQTEEEIRNNRMFVTNNDNWDSLVVWSKYEHVTLSSGPKDIQECLKLTAICDKHLCRKVNDLWWMENDEDNYLFPRMLIFHTLMVLIIAFVGQLIIFSDKSVTEPL